MYLVVYALIYFLDLVDSIFFVLAHKNSRSVIMYYHAPVIFQIVEDKTLINLIIEVG